jgi:hypothetical protein
MDKTRYPSKSIGHVTSLAKFLSVDENEMIRIANNADTFYNPRRRKKADGSFRELYSVNHELKSLQGRIVKKIYHKVHFSSFLQGSIKDAKAPRTHITDAAVHAKASVLVKMDISNFFPSLTSKVIFDIWKRFFNFSEPVAEILTKLTTFKGFLPQGAPTSPGLANLAFWDRESDIVDNLQKNGFTYTRYVDDVTVSSKSYTKLQDLNLIFECIFGMFRSKGVKPNRNKIDISTSGHAMVVHNLNLNAGVPTLPESERSRIRAAVKECESKYPKGKQSKTYKKLWESTMGRVNYLAQLNPSQAQEYIARLQAVKPAT